MGMNKGDADCTSGLSKRIFDHWTSDIRNGFVTPLEGAALDAVKAHCWALAQAVVDEISANADVTITTDDNGLQQVSGSPTEPPASNKTLSGAVS